MDRFERIIKLFGIFIVILAFIGIQIFIGLAIISMLVVPATYLYAITSDRSYNSVIDSSNMLYKLNKLGQWSLLSASALVAFYTVVFFI